MWIRVQSLMEISRINPRRTIDAFAAIEHLQSRFPSSSFAGHADFERLRLSVRDMPPKLALQRLVEIDATHPKFAAAQLEIIKCQFRLWQELNSTDSDAAQLELRRLGEFVDRYSQAENASIEDRIGALLIANEALLQSGNENELAKRLDQCDSLLTQLEPARAATVKRQVMYQQFLAAKKFRHLDRATDTARWLVNQTADTPFEPAALMYLAKDSDRIFDAAGELERGQLLPDLMVTYQRLSAVLGNDDQALRGSRNSRVVAARLADLHFFAGQYEKAQTLNQKLLALFPDERSHALLAARIYSKLGNTQAALEQWRKLALGVQPGTDIWFEAKYELIQCLTKSDVDAAKKVFRQTTLLAEDIPDPWKARFDELKTLLSN